MPIANVVLTNTFEEWRVISNETIKAINDVFNDGMPNITYRNLTANNTTSNTIYTNSIFVGGINVSTYTAASYDQANTARTHANGAFITANAAFPSTGGTISGDVYISGNLTVIGNSTVFNVSSLVINDPLIFLANNNYSSDLVDIGFVGHYNDGTNAHTGFIRDATSKEYYIFSGYTPEILANDIINIAHPSFALTNINANYYKGNVIANTAVITISSTVAGVNIVPTLSSAFDSANTAYSSAVLKTGNTMTGNLVMSGANIAFATATNSGIYWGGTGLSFIHSPAANTLVFGTSGAEDMRLDSSGRLGIGASSPVSKLTIEDGITPTSNAPTYRGSIVIATNGGSTGSSGGIEFHAAISGSGYGFRIANPDETAGSVPLVFQSRSSSSTWSERMRITQEGRVGVGTTSPTATLHVSGNVTVQAIDISGANVYSYLTGLPQNSQSAAYGLLASDAGKHILHPSADTTARTFTIPANSSVSYPIGTAITFINQHAAGNVTIAITTDTMRLAGGSSTGNRTLVANGVATAIKITFTEWIISGTGLS